MIYLLDTHAFLWAAFSPGKLSSKVKSEIRSAENGVCVSTITFWEISLKFALGKIELSNCTPDHMPQIAEQMGFEIIQPSAQETASFYQLPKVAHKDPFDRMIIWQAIQQQLPLVSKDANFPEYKKFGLQVLW
ncbi:MAG TPA: type II toxin-antitoxin system VapC family toxin [Gallionellaceae bacterium]|nr:type II toxin-antitoxin system VapC family toxin [Gallionellaceae bacterium]